MLVGKQLRESNHWVNSQKIFFNLEVWLDKGYDVMRFENTLYLHQCAQLQRPTVLDDWFSSCVKYIEYYIQLNYN